MRSRIAARLFGGELQAVGEVADAASDQFSFCVALWEAVFGVRPWDPGQLRGMAVVSSSCPPAATRQPGPRWLRRALTRGLASAPAARWPSIAALQEALRSGLHRRRRFAWGGGFAAAGLAGVVALWPAKPSCEDPSGALAGLWDENRTAALRDRVASQSAAFVQALPSIEARLDAYARDWIAARTDACEATYVRREQSEEQFDRSIACLERARHALGVSVDTLERASPEVLAEAERLLDQLPSSQACRDTRALRDGPTPPAPEIASEVQDVQQAIDRARLLETAGSVDEALELATTARARATELGYPPAVAEAAFVVGRGLAAKGDLPQAQSELFEAATVAMGSRAHELAVHAWHRLVALASVDLESHERAAEWQRLAGSAMQLMGDSGALAAEHLDHEGLTASAAGDLERAAELHRRAAEQLGSTLPADDLRVMEMERRAANALLTLGLEGNGDHASTRVDEAERIYLSLEGRVGARLGNSHPEYARTNHNLALVATARGDADEARRRFQISLDIVSVAFGPNSPRVAAALTALGRLAMATGEFERAEDFGARAWEIQQRTLPRGHSERASGLSLLAQVSLAQRELEDALTRHERLAEEFAVGANTGELPMTYQNIGWILCELDRCTEARASNTRAREIATPGQPVHRYIDALTARIVLAEGDAVGSITLAQRLLPDADEHAADDVELRAELRWTLARALATRMKPGDLERAIELVDQAARLYEDAGLRPDALPKLASLRRQWRKMTASPR